MTSEFNRGREAEFDRVLGVLYDMLDESMKQESEDEHKKMSFLILAIIMALDPENADAYV